MANMITKANAEALFEQDVVDGIIQDTVKQSKAMQLFRKLPNMTSTQMKMRVSNALPMAYWVDESTNNGRKGLTDMAWKNKFITAQELAVIVPIKQDVLDDANFDIWAEVEPRIAEAFGKAFDEAVFVGANKPSGFRDSILTTVAGIDGATITPATDETLYSTINRAMGVVEEDGYNPNGFVGGLDAKAKFRNMLDTTGQPIANTEIGEMPKYFIDNGAWDKSKAQLIVGDFSQAVYSIRQDITFKVLSEAVIQNPSTGEILYNLAQEDMVALRCVMRLGWEIPNPVTSLNGDETTRFPFAVIAPQA